MKNAFKTWFVVSVCTSVGIALGMALATEEKKHASCCKKATGESSGKEDLRKSKP